MRELIGHVDRLLQGWLTAVHTPWLDAAATWFEATGGGSLVWLLLAMASFVRRQDRAAAWRVLLSVGLAYLVAGVVLKPIVNRTRPALPATAITAGLSSPDVPARRLPPMPRSASFPSDRAAASFAAAVAVSRMWPRTRLVWWALAFLIGYARIYVGHHYPLDVLAGAVVGIGAAYWVLGGRHPATYANTLPPLPAGVVVRP